MYPPTRMVTTAFEIFNRVVHQRLHVLLETVQLAKGVIAEDTELSNPFAIFDELPSGLNEQMTFRVESMVRKPPLVNLNMTLFG